MADKWTICSGNFGACDASDSISDMAYVSKDVGRDARKVLYSFKGPTGANGGKDHWTSSPTESDIGGIISAWNIKTVGSSASSLIALAISVDETAGNSSTW